MTVQQRPLLTIAETGTRLNLNERTVRRLIARGDLPAVRLGNSIRVDPDDLEAWLEERLISREGSAIEAAVDVRLYRSPAEDS
jgi:excisionase family DNA binding protein